MGILEIVASLNVWLGLVASLATLGGIYQFITRYFGNKRNKAILGKWYGYAYFQSIDGPRFYREINIIEKSKIFPWKLIMKAHPVGKNSVTKYNGTINFNPPYIYMNTFDPIYGDRCSELYRWQMTESHEASLLVGIHLGRTFEESMHNATPMIMTSSSLDPNASESCPARADIEQQEFDRLVARYFSLEPTTLQLLLR